MRNPGRIAVVPRWVTDQTVPGHRPPVPAALSAEAVRLPQAVTSSTNGVGVVDLGADGLAVLAAASSVNLALRTPAEQDSLVAQLGSWLHTLRQPVRILIRSARLDMTAHLASLDAVTDAMSPELATAARDHADHLAGLAATEDLIRHQVLLVWRERIHPPAAPTRQFLLSAARGGGLVAVSGTDRAVFASLASPAEQHNLAVDKRLDRRRNTVCRAMACARRFVCCRRICMMS